MVWGIWQVQLGLKLHIYQFLSFQSQLEEQFQKTQVFFKMINIVFFNIFTCMCQVSASSKPVSILPHSIIQFKTLICAL